jgi:hypothetical protein
MPERSSGGPRPYRKLVNYGPTVACRLEAYCGDAQRLTGHRPSGGAALYDMIHQGLCSWAAVKRPRIVAEVERARPHRCQVAYGDEVRELLHAYMGDTAGLTGAWLSEQQALYTMAASGLAWWVAYHEPMVVKPAVGVVATFRRRGWPLPAVLGAVLARLGGG